MAPEQIINFVNDPKNMPIFLLFVAWVALWKGLALWKAARKGERVWFVGLLVINSMGLLEILYYYWLNKYSLEKLIGKK